MSEQAAIIARQNDQFRTTCGLPLSRQARAIPGIVLMRQGIAALPLPVQAEIVQAVMAFDDFNPDNDPWGEHDYGRFSHPTAGSIIWKIDYYDPELEGLSEDVTNPQITVRVLTIMLAEEW